jgi:alcohol dehydrogenase
MYGALTCGHCKACLEGRDNLCENVAGIMGFHVDGFARDRVNMPARLVIPGAEGRRPARRRLRADRVLDRAAHAVRQRQAEPGETILVQAGGSGIGTVAIKMAKAIGCTVITTVGDDEKGEKGQGARRRSRHQLPHRAVRDDHAKLTNKKGVDVVFEHVGGEGFQRLAACLKRGGRLVTCGSTAGRPSPST